MSESRKITSIEPQVKRQDRYSVFLDGEFAFGIAKDVLLESGIARNDLLSQEQIDEILKLEERRQAKEKAIRLLAVRARSTKEMAGRLQLAKFPQPAISWVIEELTRLKLLDDAEFAAAYARSRIATRPVGEYLLRHELKQKGINEPDIENAVVAAYQGSSESQLARDLAAKRKRACGSIDEFKAKKRVSDFLLRRGFKWDLIGEIMENWEEL
jgi:regulatory protein